jgi:oligo-1,6-glucosidase
MASLTRCGGRRLLKLFQEMPDLNWENADCRRAVYNSSMRFWLERGIDGFRIDTVNKYSKDTTFPDAEITDANEITQPAMKHYSNGPRIREFLLEMNDIFDKYDIFTVGELPNTPLESDVLAYVSASKRQLNMVFNFDVVSLGQTPGDRLVPVSFSTVDVKRQLSRWQTFVNGTDAWTTVFLENHDQGRSISRFGSDPEYYREHSGKMLAMILASMTGTLFLYQGQEIGMTNAPKTWGAEEYKDIRSVNFYEQIRERSGGNLWALNKALNGMQKVARDHARLPMQWDGSPNAGFCSGEVKPWMRVNDNFVDVNVEKQIRDEGSLLAFWKRLIKLRKEYKDIFVYGRYEFCDTEDEDLFIFIKTGSGFTSLTVANMSKRSKNWVGAGALFAPQLILGNVDEPEQGSLGPYETRIYIGAR